MNSIMNIEKMVDHLRKNDELLYDILKQIYSFNSGTGAQIIPDSFKTKILEYFGHKDSRGKFIESENEIIARIEHQKIIKTYNLWTGEGALFSSLRADRPGIMGMDLQNEKDFLNHLITDSVKKCDFCNPEKYTPEDIFGRVRGKYSITATNIAKYDVWSSLIIFNNHNPLKFNLREFSDYINTGFDWFKAVNNDDHEFRFPFFIWNCLPRAGASQVHGHCQILMSKEPYAKVEIIRKSFQKYKRKTGNNYFKDLYRVHRSLGLSGCHEDVHFFASITPIKEKEVVIISPENPSKIIELKKAIYRILRCFIDILGVYSYNLSISCPPIDNEKEFPYIIKIVDRGRLLNSTADMGGMELYGSSVVADDPYKVIDVLKSV
jgi:galactose-1-phosphate uridylyltransferase